MLSFEYRDKAGLLHKWTKMNLPPNLKQAMREALLAIQSHSKAHYLTGPRPQKLGVVTGRLRSSLFAKVDVRGNEIVGKIGTNVWYGRSWEEGNPKVKIHQKRPFLGPAIEDKKREVFKMFGDVIRKQVVR